MAQADVSVNDSSQGFHEGGETGELEFLLFVTTMTFDFAASFQEFRYCGGGIDVELSEGFGIERDGESFLSYR